MALHDQAMLANLSIRQWDARRYDKTATRDVEQKHGAQNAGRFNKLLIDEVALAPISKVASAMRTEHYKQTMPWGDNGDRLLPSRLYLGYTQTMRLMGTEFKSKVDDFVKAYPTLVAAARSRLGSLYEPSDYPLVSQVSDKFGIDISYMPVPSAKDFRVDVAAKDVELIRSDINRRIEERQAEAIKDAVSRAKTFLKRVYETMSTEKPRIYDSLMGNIGDLAKMLPAFNITEDPRLTQLESELAGLVVPTDRLRADPYLREKTAEKAGLILQNLSWA